MLLLLSRVLHKWRSCVSLKNSSWHYVSIHTSYLHFVRFSSSLRAGWRRKTRVKAVTWSCQRRGALPLGFFPIYCPSQLTCRVFGLPAGNVEINVPVRQNVTRAAKMARLVRSARLNVYVKKLVYGKNKQKLFSKSKRPSRRHQ